MTKGNVLRALSFEYFVFIAYWTVLVSELVGDKSIYTVSSLALRFRPGIVLSAVIVSSASKMFAAVLLGGLVIQLDSRWTDLVSACAFFVSATLIWFEDQETSSGIPALHGSWSRAAIVSFGSLFFAEWGDPGQISAAALTLKSHSPFAIWMGGTLAMASKGGLAMVLGVKLHDRLPQRKLQALASMSCCVLGALTLARLVFGRS